MNLKITRQRNIYFAFSVFMVALAIGAMIFKCIYSNRSR